MHPGRSSKLLTDRSIILIQSTVYLFLLVGTLAAPCRAQAVDAAEQCLDDAWRSPDVAIQDCTEAIDNKLLTDKSLVHSLNSRGWAYRRKKDYDRALDDYNRAIQLKPDYAEAFNGRGLAYYGKKEYEQAIQDYSQAILLKHDYAEAFNNRGLACLATREYSNMRKAMADFDQAIELEPHYAEAFFNRGNAHAEEGQFKDAIPDYTEAIRLRPDYPEALLQRSDAYRYRHDNGHALQDLNQAIKLKPDDTDAIFARASIYGDGGYRDRAIEDLTEVIRLSPDDLQTFWFRAMTYFDNGDYDLAISDLNRVVGAQPEINYKTVSYIHQRGLAYLYKGDYDQAIRDFEQVGKVETYDFYREGLAYFYLGQFENAGEAFERGGQFIYSNVWAYLAARRAGGDAKEELHRMSDEAALVQADWPVPVARYYAGSITEEQLLSAARSDDLQDKNPCMCDNPESGKVHNKYHTHQTESAAYFYLGEHELLSGHSADAKALFQQSIVMGVKNTDEYQGAVVEIRRMKAPGDVKPPLK